MSGNMTKVAVLDDWQGVAQGAADWGPLKARADVTFFADAFADQDDAAAKLADFDIVLSMRERTPLPGPIAVWVDRLGRIWVSATNNRVQLFTPEGRYLLTLGGAGDGPGQFRLPHGMATDSQGNIYVADASNQRIQKFAP